jgi:type I restriction enzyme M protein
MLSPHIKKKVDKLWDRFWAAGLTNPLVAIEQITYLLFLKRLEAVDLARTRKGQPSIYLQTEDDKRREFNPDTCRWGYIRQEKSNPQHLIDVVFPWLRTLEQRLSGNTNGELATVASRLGDAYFQLDPGKGAILGEAIDIIDDLFARVGESSAAQDVMGDTFEYLLSEISTAGKNGQFRTPRHLIRLMVEILDPEPGAHIIDPAAGTGGFLFSSQQYLLRKYTSPETLRLEWDGAPHRTYGDLATKEQDAAMHDGAFFVGVDNDRTMARIGWMNLILHGISTPAIVQGDSLSKREGKPDLAILLKPESYDFVLANPPFTGTVDTADLEQDSRLFPRAGEKGKKKNEALTNKSELLFVWLMLDLLRIGGRCAVIMPEGVLFGNTDAHLRLRRELLTEHAVEAVISLPAGVFQPYTLVKTSILVFRKETPRDSKSGVKFSGMPRTQTVWFYEVNEDGFNLDAKRNPKVGKNNDIWDAIKKFGIRIKGDQIESQVYFQPRYRDERWRVVDEALLAQYPDEAEVRAWQGKVAGIHELFPPITGNGSTPAEIENYVSSICQPRIGTLLASFLNFVAAAVFGEVRILTNPNERRTEAERLTTKLFASARRLLNDQRALFDEDESIAWRIFQTDFNSTLSDLRQDILRKCEAGEWTDLANGEEAIGENQESRAIALEYAKLDGFNVTLRSLEVEPQSEPPKAAKSWIIPVRLYAQNDDWVSKDNRVKGSHDETGHVRPEYVAATPVYDESGVLIEGVLDPECIEARGWTLSAPQYKPFDFAQLRSEKSVVELIQELQANQRQIGGGLDKLLAMAEGRE